MPGLQRSPSLALFDTRFQNPGTKSMNFGHMAAWRELRVDSFSFLGCWLLKY